MNTYDIESMLERAKNPPPQTACPVHGIVPDGPWSECAECASDVRAAEREHYRACKLFDAFRRCGVSRRFAGKTVEGWKPQGRANKAAHELLLAYSQNIRERARDGRGLVLLGGVGIGKSHLACALVADAIGADLDATYITWPAAITLHRDAQQGAKDNPARGLWRELESADLLALDEVALMPMTEWQAGELFRLIDGRYQAQRATIVAGNLTADSLASALGERVADRLRDMCALVPLSGESKRGQPPQTEPLRFAKPEPVKVEVWAGSRWVTRTIGGERAHGRGVEL